MDNCYELFFNKYRHNAFWKWKCSCNLPWCYEPIWIFNINPSTFYLPDVPFIPSAATGKTESPAASSRCNGQWRDRASSKSRCCSGPASGVPWGQNSNPHKAGSRANGRKSVLHWVTGIFLPSSTTSSFWLLASNCRCRCIIYSWWKKSCTTQGLYYYWDKPTFTYPPSGAGFVPSTVLMITTVGFNWKCPL